MKSCIHHVLLLEDNSHEEIEKTISLLEHLLIKICQRDRIQQIAQWCYDYHFKYTSKEEKTLIDFFERYTYFSKEKILPHIKNSYNKPIDIQIEELLMTAYYSGISSSIIVDFEPQLYFKPGKKGTLFYIRLPNETMGERFYIESTQFKNLYPVNFITGQCVEKRDREPYCDILDEIKEKSIKPPISWLYQKRIDIYKKSYMRKDIFEILEYLPCEHQRLEDFYRKQRGQELRENRKEEIKEIIDKGPSYIADITGIMREIEREVDREILDNNHLEKMKEYLNDLESYESIVSTILNTAVRLV